MSALLFIIDDWGFGDAGFTTHNSSCTPFIDRLAAEGTPLDLRTWPTCTPSRSALLTSRYPSDYGMQHLMPLRREDYGTPVDVLTWGELLGDEYDTGLFGKWHLGESRIEFTPSERGFETSMGFYGSSIGYYTHEEQGGRDWFINGIPQFNNSDVGTYSTDLIADAFIEWLPFAGVTHPFFGVVAFQAAHQPMDLPPGNLDCTAGWVDGEPTATRLIYNRIIRYTDAAIERIFTSLTEKGWDASNLRVAITGDNGGIPDFGGYPYFRGEKGSVYEGGVRVPALLWGRGVDLPPKTQASIVDLIPTLLNRGYADGIDLLNEKRRETLVQLDWCHCPFDWTCQQPCQCPPKPLGFPNTETVIGLVVGNKKLVYHGLTPELYLLDIDPFETRNVARSHPRLTAELTARASEYYERATEIIKPPCDPEVQPINGWWLPI